MRFLDDEPVVVSRHTLVSNDEDSFVGLLQTWLAKGFLWLAKKCKQSTRTQEVAESLGGELGMTAGAWAKAQAERPVVEIDKGKAEAQKALAESLKLEVESQRLLDPAMNQAALDNIRAQTLKNTADAYKTFQEIFEKETGPLIAEMMIKYGHAGVMQVDGKPCFVIGYDPRELLDRSINTDH